MVEQAHPAHDAKADAKVLVEAAKDFTNSGSVEAGEHFTKQWQQVVTAGATYRNEVEAQASKLSNGSWNVFVPSAEVSANSISFNGSMAADASSGSHRKIAGFNDGEVVGLGTSPHGTQEYHREGVPSLVAEEQAKQREQARDKSHLLHDLSLQLRLR